MTRPTKEDALKEEKSKRLAKQIRKALIKNAKTLRNDKVVCFMSGGVDSQTCLFALLEAGIVPTISSFTLEDRESRDFRTARDIAKTFDLKFVPIKVPVDIDTIKRRMIENVFKYNCRSKVEIECFYPIRYAIDKAAKQGHTAVVTGQGADTMYCLSRKANVHYPNREDEYRDTSRANPNWNQRQILMDYCSLRGLKFVPMYQIPEIWAAFKGLSHDEANYPTQKYPSRAAFPEYFKDVRTYSHQPYQHGDTGIRDLFEILIESDWNLRNYKSVSGIYNAVKRGEVTVGSAPNLFDKLRK
jgi:asparagine synthetase B (glutamine-hydrolysing)